MRCRTAALGGHKTVCNDCGHVEISYNSCRNRNCPQCRIAAQEEWIRGQAARLLRTHYFHTVFTPPPELRPLFRANPELLYGLLLSCSSRTLLQFGYDRFDAQLGVVSVLHTWNRRMEHHPHAHNIVTGGGLSRDGSRWVPAKRNFLFPVRALGIVFRAMFIKELRRLRSDGKLSYAAGASAFESDADFGKLLAKLRKRQWLVYSEPTFSKPEHVIRYLGRYTHRLAISDYRLVEVTETAVTFSTRGDQTLTLEPIEFLRRFLSHVLPSRFRRIRNSGILANSNLRTKWQRATELIGRAQTEEQPQQQADDTPRCTKCHSYNVERIDLPVPSFDEQLAIIRSAPTRGPPPNREAA